MKPKNQLDNLKKLALGAFLSVGVFAAQAQDYAFKVMASNGTNTLQGSKSRLWAGSSIASKDVIVVANGGYLGLMYNNGRTLELKQAGTYKASDLAAKVSGAKASTAAKYANYVVGEMTKADREDINKNHKKYMATTGSVNRAHKSNALIYRPLGNNNENILVANAVVDFTLYPNPTLSLSKDTKYYYVVSVTDMRDKVVATYEVPVKENGEASNLKIDFSKFDFKYDPEWVVNVNFKGLGAIGKENCKVQLLTKDGEHAKLYQEVSEFVQVEEPTALDKILEARFYEERQLLLDASRCYQEAIKMQNVDTYKVAYQDFLIRNKMLLGADGNIITLDPKYNVQDVSKEEASTEKTKEKKIK